MTRQQIADIVTRHTGVPWWQITSEARTKRIVAARDLAVGLARRHTIMSYPEIAAWLNRRSHSAMVVAGRRVEQEQRDRLDALDT